MKHVLIKGCPNSVKNMLVWMLFAACMPVQHILCASVATHTVIVPVTNVVSTRVEYNRPAPVGTSEAPHLLAQLNYNEQVTELETKEEWSRVKVDSVYVCSREKECRALHGWVKSEHISDKPNKKLCQQSCTTLTCVAPWTPVYVRASAHPHRFQLHTKFSYATKLQGLAKEDEWWRVLLADGNEAWVPAPCVMIDGPVSEADMRAQIVAHARQFLGCPYCWGGCSAHDPSETSALTGFDCSGLVYKLFQVAGKSVPRNSRSQFFFAVPCKPAELEAGDLIFRSEPAVSPHVSHVMLYTGEGTIIEAWAARADNGSMNVQPIHEISVEEKIGKSLDLLTYSEQVGRYVFYTGKVI